MKHHKRDSSLITLDEAWRNLAVSVLLFAVKDARQKKNIEKRERARAWLLSPAAVLFFDAFDIEINVKAWVQADCPNIK
jgi:hypothetical protein